MIYNRIKIVKRTHDLKKYNLILYTVINYQIGISYSDKSNIQLTNLC